MTNKKFWLVGILVMVLVFSFVLIGCDLFDDSYTFEFKVNNNVIASEASYITKIEFFNGSNENAKILQTENVNLPGKQMSSAYKVSGFTEKDGDERRFFGVKVTFIGGDTIFNYSSRADNSKIIVDVSNFLWLTMSFSNGNW
jgi:hypothetical protein